MQCDWVGGENLVQFLSVRIHLSLLSIYSPGGMNDFHITTRRTAFAHTLLYEVFCGRVFWNEGTEWDDFWRTGHFLFFYIYYLFPTCTVTDVKEATETKKTKRVGDIYACVRASERAAISSECSSFPLCQRLIVYYGSGWVSCTFTLCDKTADHRVRFNHATTASSTFTAFIYMLRRTHHILSTVTYRDNTQAISISGVSASWVK